MRTLVESAAQPPIDDRPAGEYLLGIGAKSGPDEATERLYLSVR